MGFKSDSFDEHAMFDVFLRLQVLERTFLVGSRVLLNTPKATRGVPTWNPNPN